MADHNLRFLPVVDAEGTPAGVLSIEDIVLKAESADLLSEEMFAAIKVFWRQPRRPAPLVLKPAKEARLHIVRPASVVRHPPR
jgi:hypothetical protein